MSAILRQLSSIKDKGECRETTMLVMDCLEHAWTIRKLNEKRSREGERLVIIREEIQRQLGGSSSGAGGGSPARHRGGSPTPPAHEVGASSSWNTSVGAPVWGSASGAAGGGFASSAPPAPAPPAPGAPAGGLASPAPHAPGPASGGFASSAPPAPGVVSGGFASSAPPALGAVSGGFASSAPHPDVPALPAPSVVLDQPNIYGHGSLYGGFTSPFATLHEPVGDMPSYASMIDDLDEQAPMDDDDDDDMRASLRERLQMLIDVGGLSG